MLKNIMARPITIKQGVKVAVIEAVNAMPNAMHQKKLVWEWRQSASLLRVALTPRTLKPIPQNWKESTKQKWTEHYSLQTN